MNILKYRPDIDGLRAIAVLSVVLFHIKPKWIPSGFLGVDIFFVLSGFLITSIIYKEMLSGTFSFTDFYNRRIKRILPVFFVVLIAGLLVSNYLFLPKDSQEVIKSALFSLIFLANLFFAKGKAGYFDTTSDEKPFLHLWSLSIEEQFYFVFPLFLLFILKVPFLQKNTLRILGLGILISLFSAFIDLNKIGIYWDTYYFSHIRIGELLIGSFLAIYCRENKPKEKRKINTYIALFSLIMLILCLFLDKVFVSPLFPGVLALVPCLATAWLIYINQVDNKISSILSLKPLVWVGKISYSLYLWHWVVLAIMRYVYQESELPLEWNLVAIIIMLILSVLTYYFIENPLRKLKWSFGKSLTFFYLIPFGIVLIIAYGIPQNNIPKELEYPENICHNKVGENCIKGDISKTPKVLFVGNSFVGQLNPWIDKIGKSEGWSAMVISSDLYPFAFDIDWGQENRFLYDSAQNRDKFFIEHYKDFPIIVFHYDMQERADFYPKFLATIRRLKKEGKKVYVITSVKWSNINVLRHHYLSGKNLSFNKIQKQEEETLDFIPNNLEVRKVDLRPYVPDSFYIDGKPVLKDEAHWNTYGAEKIADIFLSKGKRFIKKEDLE